MPCAAVSAAESADTAPVAASDSASASATDAPSARTPESDWGMAAGTPSAAPAVAETSPPSRAPQAQATPSMPAPQPPLRVGALPPEPIIVAPRIDWTADGQVLLTTTILPAPSAGALTNPQLTITSTDGMIVRPLPAAMGKSLGHSFVSGESRIIDGPTTVALGQNLHGRQLAGLLAVPKDHPSTVTLTVTATGAQGLVTVTKTLAIDPRRPTGGVLVIESPTPERAHPVLPSRSAMVWTEEAPQ